jgi:hypothetical protein
LVLRENRLNRVRRVAPNFQFFDNPAGVAAPLPLESEQTPEERAWVRALATYQAAELDYLNEQRNKPQTVALALTDSPNRHQGIHSGGSAGASFMFGGFALGALLGSATIARASPAALGFVGAGCMVAALILA